MLRFKSKILICFQKWKNLAKKSEKQDHQTRKVAFALQSLSPTHNFVRNVVLKKNKPFLKKVMQAWIKYAQTQQLKRLKEKEKRIKKALKSHSKKTSEKSAKTKSIKTTKKKEKSV